MNEHRPAFYCRLLSVLQGLYQDIVAYDHMIESAKVKATELTVQSPRSRVGPLSSQIVMNYAKVKENTKVSVTVIEGAFVEVRNCMKYKQSLHLVFM